MKLQTSVPLSKPNRLIDYDSRLLLLGSCFSEHMGKKFDYCKFRCLSNPFGILFHPQAIAHVIERAVYARELTKEDAFELNGQWHSFDAHSEKSAATQQKLITGLNLALEHTREQLQAATHVLITLGTAWVYRHTATGHVVANCHKVPQKQFSKELLSVTELVDALKRMRQAIRSINPGAQLVFTLSPVRHLKDGFVQNQRSKAHLITAIHQLLDSSSQEGGKAYYFPSYEIMMDELRDYRFYDPDMIHPNQTAVDYIWEKFKEVAVRPEAFSTMDKVTEVQKGMAHRPFNPGTAQHKKFQKSLQQKITRLQKEFPWMFFETGLETN